jgi:hypothetical protein
MDNPADGPFPPHAKKDPAVGGVGPGGAGAQFRPTGSGAAPGAALMGRAVSVEREAAPPR